MTTAFVLQHVRPKEDDVKLIGVYSSRENAQAAVSRLGRAPGFSDDPDGFHIDEYQMDQDHWTEGFGSLNNVPLLQGVGEHS